MNKYYIPEIDLKRIRNHPEILDQLHKVYNTSKENKQIIISTDGYYHIQEDKLTKHKIINKESSIKENFINKMTLIGMNFYYKKIGEAYHVPYEHSVVNLEISKFFSKNLPTKAIKDSNSNITYLVIEKNKDKNKIIDLYFLSKKNILEDDYFFSKDMSSFIETLNV